MWIYLCMCVCVVFQSVVKTVILPRGLKSECNDVEWKRFIEALSLTRPPSLPHSLCLSVSSSISSSLSPSSSMSPSLCFYGGIIISLSHPLLFRLKQNNKFQDHADAALLQLKLILWTRQKRCTKTTQDNKDCSTYLLSSCFQHFKTILGEKSHY